MSAGFGTQPEDLDAAARRFDEAADVLTAAHLELRSTLDRLGDYLGSDEQGRAFAAQYVPKAAEGLDAMAREVDALGSAGPALREAAQAFRDTDAAGAAELGPLGPG